MDVGSWQGCAARGGAQETKDLVADGQESRHQDRVHLGRDGQAAAFVLQPGAEAGG